MLAKELQEEMDALLLKDNPTDADLARVEELEALELPDEESEEDVETTNNVEKIQAQTTESTLLKNDGLEGTNGNTVGETQQEDEEDNLVPEETEEEAEIVETEDVDALTPEELSKLKRAGECLKYYTVLEVTPKKDWNQLWGLYESELENGLACSTKCFAIDITQRLQVGDECELPETATTIRQSHRKARPGDTNDKPSTFDWLHF